MDPSHQPVHDATLSTRQVSRFPAAMVEEPAKGRRNFVVGDLHGQYQPLLVKLAAVQFDRQQDHLYSIGDLIDRGPDSLALLRLFREHAWCSMVLGNHEMMLIEAVLGSVSATVTWLMNGGEWSESLPSSVLREWADWLQTQPLVRTLRLADGRSVGLVHANCPENWQVIADWTQTKLEREFLLWNRERAHQARLQQRQEHASGMCEPIQHIDMTIHGHSPMEAPVWCGNSLFIDCGCALGHSPVLIQLESLAPGRPVLIG